MDTHAVFDMFKDFGPLIGIVLFFIWRDWKREDSLVSRVKHLEDFNTETLSNLVKESSAVIATNTEQLRIMNGLMTGCKGRQDG
jgi:hypothetical protein